MKAVSLLYHDVVRHRNFETSGFPGEGAARYKLSRDEFDRHLATLKRVLKAKPVTVSDRLNALEGSHHVMLTFDDGGRSAYPEICDALDRYGWKGHFFVTTNCIGRPTFLSENDIRAVRRRGHVIGSHSSSHPERMSRQDWKQLMKEWSVSIKRLSDILGEEVAIASVPNGYYSRKVAEAASLSGVRALFTSEPVRHTHSVRDCVVFGRYIIRPGMAPERVADLATSRSWPRCKEYLIWNTKKLAKVVGGEAYLQLRAYFLEHLKRDAQR